METAEIRVFLHEFASRSVHDKNRENRNPGGKKSGPQERGDADIGFHVNLNTLGNLRMKKFVTGRSFLTV